MTRHPVRDSGVVKSQFDGLEDCPLHRNSPYVIGNVSQTQLSIARYYGGVRLNGEQYFYVPPTDELVRSDVIKWKATKDKQKNKKLPKKKSLRSDGSQKQPVLVGDP